MDRLGAGYGMRRAVALMQSELFTVAADGSRIDRMVSHEVHPSPSAIIKAYDQIQEELKARNAPDEFIRSEMHRLFPGINPTVFSDFESSYTAVVAHYSERTSSTRLQMLVPQPTREDLPMKLAIERNRYKAIFMAGASNGMMAHIKSDVSLDVPFWVMKNDTPHFVFQAAFSPEAQSYLGSMLSDATSLRILITSEEFVRYGRNESNERIIFELELQNISHFKSGMASAYKSGEHTIMTDEPKVPIPPHHSPQMHTNASSVDAPNQFTNSTQQLFVPILISSIHKDANQIMSFEFPWFHELDILSDEQKIYADMLSVIYASRLKDVEIHRLAANPQSPVQDDAMLNMLMEEGRIDQKGERYIKEKGWLSHIDGDEWYIDELIQNYNELFVGEGIFNVATSMLQTYNMTIDDVIRNTTSYQIVTEDFLRHFAVYRDSMQYKDLPNIYNCFDPDFLTCTTKDALSVGQLLMVLINVLRAPITHDDISTIHVIVSLLREVGGQVIQVFEDTITYSVDQSSDPIKIGDLINTFRNRAVAREFFGAKAPIYPGFVANGDETFNVYDDDTELLSLPHHPVHSFARHVYVYLDQKLAEERKQFVDVQ